MPKAKGRKDVPPSKGTRRASGTGALFFSESRRVWIGRVAVGKKPDGSPLYAERSDRTQAGVLRKLEAVQPPGDQTTLTELAARWRADMRVRERTADSRANSLDVHIVPVLGGTRVADLTAGQIELAARRWLDVPLKASTVNLVLDHLGTLLEEAVRFGLRPDNPVKAVRRPKSVKAKIDPFTAAELCDIIEAATGGRRARVVAVLAAVGCRVGESLALDVGDYDPKGHTLSITKTLSIKRKLGPPKSAAGVRVVYVPEQAHPAIRDAIGTRKAGPLFAADTGSRGWHSGVSRAFEGVLKKCGVRRRNPHQLRHSVASLAIAAGVPIANVARDLGDTVGTIIATYLHATIEGAAVGPTMEGLLSGRRVERP